jgi:uncharacterized membrane protein YgdD (TMEM256/DUF423 family)
MALNAGIIAAGLAVLLGAFGAHGLKSRVGPDLLAIWQTGVTYQFFHALALILLALWMRQTVQTATVALWCFVLGMVIFSGSLYLLTLTGVRGLGAITPIGGVLLILGWVAWLVRAVRT